MSRFWTNGPTLGCRLFGHTTGNVCRRCGRVPPVAGMVALRDVIDAARRATPLESALDTDDGEEIHIEEDGQDAAER